MIQYAAEHTPPMLILENVPELLKPNQSNLSTMTNRLDQVGYSMTSTAVNANTQGSSLWRKRAYLFVLHRGKLGLTKETATQVLENILSIFKRFDILPVQTFHNYLLPNNDNTVQAELSHMQANVSTGLADDKWPDQHMKFLDDDGVAACMVQPPEETRKSPWYGVLTPRARQILGYKMQSCPDALTVELSQSMGRSSLSPDTESDCILDQAAIHACGH